MEFIQPWKLNPYSAKYESENPGHVHPLSTPYMEHVLHMYSVRSMKYVVWSRLYTLSDTRTP